MENSLPSNSESGRSAVRDLVLELARSLADQPEAVEVDWVESDSGPLLEILAEAADVERLNGERGRTLRSLALVVKACAIARGYDGEVRLVVEAWSSEDDLLPE
jgi:predicted RNA-binding protein YlqC (UPF0109 family)